MQGVICLLHSRMSQRQKQIGTLYSYFPAHQITISDPNSRFSVSLTISRLNVPILLKITLPEQFPDEAPHITVSPPIAHRWVGRDMRVFGHESLATWNRTLCLGKILKDIELEFNLRPPQLLPGFTPSSEDDSRPPTVKNLNFPEINALSRFFAILDLLIFSPYELKTLIDDERKFDEFFSKLAPVKEALSVHEELLLGNCKLAGIFFPIHVLATHDPKLFLERNVELKGKLSDLESRIHELHSLCEVEASELLQLKKSVTTSKPEYSGTTVLEQQNSRILLHDKESQNALDSWCAEKHNVNQFLSSFRQARSSFHRQNIVCEKIKQHLYSD